MKISLNWVKEYTKVDLPIDKLLDKIGSQLGAVEEIVDLKAKYEGLVIVKVISVNPHINADKLHVCLIDDGRVIRSVERFPDNSEPAVTRGLVQVVCGANNIKEGQLVVWIPPGSAVPKTAQTAEKVVIDTKEVRGVVSHGMIASARELDFGDDHEGIVVVDEDIKPGTPLSEAYDLDDYIIDIENKMFTHRPDCFGLLGVAREIAGIQGIQFISPDWYLNGGLVKAIESSEELPLEIKNEVPDVVSRFMAIALSNIKIGPSPLRMQIQLAKLGIKPVNNIVDITNYMMALTGQPMHTYDYDKVARLNSDNKARLIIRLREKRSSELEGEEITLLGGRRLVLNQKAETIVIATDRQTIGIGGVMGGEDTEIDGQTKNIILEVANFDMYSIRKTAMEYGLFTDAFVRFSKGQSLLQNDKVLAKAVEMLEQTGGRIASRIVDDNHSMKLQPVEVTADFVSQRLGLEITAEEIIKTLQNVEFTVRPSAAGSKLQITAPFWRTDITIPEDVVEEVGRLIGYHKIPLQLPKRDLTPVKTNAEFNLKRQIRDILSASGANEVLTYNFVHGNLLDKVGQNKEVAFQLSNALSPDLQYYRLSLSPSLLEKIHPNIKQGYTKFALFEIGKCHMKGWLNSKNTALTEDRDLPMEESRLAFVFTDLKTSGDTVFFEAKKYLYTLLEKLGIEPAFEDIPERIELEITKQMTAPYDKKRSASIIVKNSGNFLGIVGEFQTAVIKSLKLPKSTAGFEIDLSSLLSFAGQIKYQPLSRYPNVEQDITLKTSAEVKFGQLEQVVKNSLNQLVDKTTLFKLIPLDIYCPQGGRSKHYTFRVVITPYAKTLKSKDVNDLLDKVAKEASKELQVTRL